MLRPFTIAARKTAYDHTARMEIELTSREAGKLLGALKELFRTRGLWADDVPLYTKLKTFVQEINDDTAFESEYDAFVNKMLRGQRRFIIALPSIRCGKQEWLMELGHGGKIYGTAEPLNAKPFSREEYADKFVADNQLLGATVFPIGRKFLS